MPPKNSVVGPKQYINSALAEAGALQIPEAGWSRLERVTMAAPSILAFTERTLLSSITVEQGALPPKP